jgi:hypothetical protein
LSRNDWQLPVLKAYCAAVAGPQGLLRIMGDRLLTVGAIVFGIIIPIAFLVIAWFTL